jgi:hypothetical protein
MQKQQQTFLPIIENLFYILDIRKIIGINNLIKSERTVTPKTLSTYSAISEQATHHYLKFMRNELNAPIKWDAKKKSYTYKNEGELKMAWEEKMNNAA